WSGRKFGVSLSVDVVFRDGGRGDLFRSTGTSYRLTPPRGTHTIRKEACTMDQNPGTHGSRTMLYFLAGIATGATVALLTAPQSGRETRRKIKQLKDQVTDRASRVGLAIGEAYRQATEAGKKGFVHSLNGTTTKASRSLHASHH